MAEQRPLPQRADCCGEEPGYQLRQGRGTNVLLNEDGPPRPQVLARRLPVLLEPIKAARRLEVQAPPQLAPIGT